MAAFAAGLVVLVLVGRHQRCPRCDDRFRIRMGCRNGFARRCANCGPHLGRALRGRA